MQMVIFIICNMLNVIIQTIKSIVTIKGSKISAALANAIAYGFYTYIVILMVSDMSTFAKCIIVGFCNLVGVYFVKLAEEKKRKDKLWKVEVAAPAEQQLEIDNALCKANVSFNGQTTATDDYTIYQVYCIDREEFKKVSAIIKQYNLKSFVAESKIEL